MIEFIQHIGQALFMSLAMAWQVGWSLVLGFTLSGLIQAVVSKDRMREQLGRPGFRSIALATGFGAASSSCSYAAAAMSKTLFKKGAALAPSLAFLFSSTNLVVELGLILYLLMGWQFMAAEWVGGIVLVIIMSVLVKVTYPKKLVAEARAHVEAETGLDHGDDVVAGETIWQKLRDPQTRVIVAQNAAMDWSMLYGDLAIGFLVAGAITVFVPPNVWHVLFLQGLPSWEQVVFGSIVGAVLAILTFVCSIGNVPMAAVLWSAGLSFGGTLSFLYADLIVLPLLDVYRKYYGLKMAAYIFGIFFITMVTTAILMDGAFSALHLIPATRPDVRGMVESFSLNYTFWLNLIAAGVVIWMTWINKRNPMETTHDCCSAEA